MQGNPEAEVCSIEVAKVVLPSGDIKNNVVFNTENTIMEEKENILRQAQIPYPILYVLVVHGPNRSREVLEDSKYVDAYLDVIGRGAECEIHIEKKSSQVERAPRPVNTELFNINLKP
ncbi:hypothetical protein BsWGS_28592 [Bradybaena similaris]